MSKLTRAQRFRRIHQEPREVELSEDKTVLMTRPTMPGLLAQGKIPNTLFISAGVEESGIKPSPLQMIKQNWELNYTLCQAAFVDPPFRASLPAKLDEHGDVVLDEEGNSVPADEDPDVTYPWHYTESELYAAIAYANEGDEGLRAFHSERRRALAGSDGEEVREDS